MTLSVGQSPVMSLSWIDHKGGAIAENYDESIQQQALIKDLKSADAVVLFCAADRLARGAEDELELYYVLPALGQAMIGDSSLATILIVLTKTDLVKSYTEEMLQPIAGFITTMGHASDRIQCAIVDVACGPKPRHVVSTVNYVLRALLVGESRKQTKLAKSKRSTASYWYAQHEAMSLWQRLGNWLNDETSDKAVGDSCLSEAWLAERNSSKCLGFADAVVSQAEAEQKVMVIARGTKPAECVAFLNRHKTVLEKLKLLLMGER